MSEAAEYEVKKLLARRRDNQGNYEFLVRWSGRYSDPKFDSWEPFSNLEGTSEDAIQEYEKSHPDVPLFDCIENPGKNVVSDELATAVDSFYSDPTVARFRTIVEARGTTPAQDIYSCATKWLLAAAVAANTPADTRAGTVHYGTLVDLYLAEKDIGGLTTLIERVLPLIPHCSASEGKYNRLLGDLLERAVGGLIAERPAAAAAIARTQLLSLCGHVGRAARRAWVNVDRIHEAVAAGEAEEAAAAAEARAKEEAERTAAAAAAAAAEQAAASAAAAARTEQEKASVPAGAGGSDGGGAAATTPSSGAVAAQAGDDDYPRGAKRKVDEAALSASLAGDPPATEGGAGGAHRTGGTETSMDVDVDVGAAAAAAAARAGGEDQTAQPPVEQLSLKAQKRAAGDTATSASSSVSDGGTGTASGSPAPAMGAAAAAAAAAGQPGAGAGGGASAELEKLKILTGPLSTARQEKQQQQQRKGRKEEATQQQQQQQQQEEEKSAPAEPYVGQRELFCAHDSTVRRSPSGGAPTGVTSIVVRASAHTPAEATLLVGVEVLMLVTRRTKEYWSSRWSQLRPQLEEYGVKIISYPFRPRGVSAGSGHTIKSPCIAHAQLDLFLQFFRHHHTIAKGASAGAGGGSSGGNGNGNGNGGKFDTGGEDGSSKSPAAATAAAGGSGTGAYAKAIAKWEHCGGRLWLDAEVLQGAGQGRLAVVAQRDRHIHRLVQQCLREDMASYAELLARLPRWYTLLHTAATVPHALLAASSSSSSSSSSCDHEKEDRQGGASKGDDATTAKPEPAADAAGRGEEAPGSAASTVVPAATAEGAPAAATAASPAVPQPSAAAAAAASPLSSSSSSSSSSSHRRLRCIGRPAPVRVETVLSEMAFALRRTGGWPLLRTQPPPTDGAPAAEGEGAAERRLGGAAPAHSLSRLVTEAQLQQLPPTIASLLRLASCGALPPAVQNLAVASDDDDGGVGALRQWLTSSSSVVPN